MPVRPIYRGIQKRAVRQLQINSWRSLRLLASVSFRARPHAGQTSNRKAGTGVLHLHVVAHSFARRATWCGLTELATKLTEMLARTGTRRWTGCIHSIWRRLRSWRWSARDKSERQNQPETHAAPIRMGHPLFSIKIHRRPNLSAATPVDPLPANRSKTRSPGLDEVAIMISANRDGFSQGLIFPLKSSVMSVHTFVRRLNSLRAG